MARTLFGGSPADYAATTQVIGQYTVPVVQPGVSLTAWTARTGGSQLVDLETAAGAAATVVTADELGRVLFYGPDPYTVPIWLQDPPSGVRYRIDPASGAGGGSAGAPNTVVVAASGSGITDADYFCDGTADDVEINAALAAVRAAGGGTVQLTGGSYILAAPIVMEGFDDVDVAQDLYLRGAGPANTTLAVSSGVSAGIRWTASVRAHVWDVGIVMAGSSDGVQAVPTATPAAGHRSAWLSSIARVQVQGPFDGSDTGWAFDLDNVFRSTIENVEVNGTTNGMRWYNSDSDFNAGDSTINRCFVDLSSGAAGGIAYSMESAAGNMNQLLFMTCHAIANAGVANTVCWRFAGAGATSHIRMINCNVEQFAVTILLAATAYDIDADFVHVTLRNGSTLADLDGHDSRIRVGQAYVEPSATTLLIDDDNNFSRKPNIVGPIALYADTGSTVNADVDAYCIVRDITYDGPGTVAAAVKVGPGVTTQSPAIALTDAATVATDASLGSTFAVTAMAGNRTIGVPTNPTPGQEITWRLTASGGARTPVFATGAGGFVLAGGTPAVTVSAIASGSTAEVSAVYNATDNRWRISRYQTFTAT